MADPAGRIHRLHDALISTIAAGEVIERPASVVKELVENSLDAGARTVRIRVDGDGTRLIRVSDDGGGMSRADVRLAVERHATSKIAEFADLAAIATLGFRGEALASIGAVARLSLASALPEAQGGWRLEVVHGVVAAGPEPVAHPAGTTVEVRDLFAAVPARRKFLRSPRTELHHVQEVVRRLALARPEEGFQLSADERQWLSVRAGGGPVLGLTRLARIVGREFAGVALAVDAAAADLRVSGWVAPALAARNQTDIQYLSLNGRPIRDTVLQRAVRRAYDDTLPPGQHPGYVLALRMPVECFDVNVHPAKAEVRFHDPRSIHDFVFKAVRDALAQPTREAPVAIAAGRAAPPAPVRSAAGLDAWRVYRSDRDSATPRIHEAPGPGLAPRPLGHAVAAVANRFLVTTIPGAVYLVDARTACAHYTHARLLRGALRPRPLLVPARAPLARATDWIERHGSALAALGFELTALGPGEIALRQVPTVLEVRDGAALLGALLAELPLDGGSTAPAALLRAVAEAVAADLDLETDAQSWLRAAESALAAGEWPWDAAVRVLDAGACASLLPRRPT
jgi:DNA mismatch repair protein MutL